MESLIEARKEASEIRTTVEKLVKDFNWKYPELTLSVSAETTNEAVYTKGGIMISYALNCDYSIAVKK
jgi:hypothetical protein